MALLASRGQQAVEIDDALNMSKEELHDATLGHGEPSERVCKRPKENLLRPYCMFSSNLYLTGTFPFNLMHLYESSVPSSN